MIARYVVSVERVRPCVRRPVLERGSIVPVGHPLPLATEALVEGRSWMVAQCSFAAGQIRPGVLCIAGLRRFTLHMKIAAGCPAKCLNQFEKRRGSVRPEIENVKTVFVLKCSEYAFNDVFHEGVVTA